MKLSERAMLVSLTLGAWGGNLIDREVTEEVSENHHADSKDAGRYNKQIISRKFLRAVGSKVSVARQTHKTLTLPWDDSARILAASGYIHYTEQMRLNRLAVEAASREFEKNYPDYIVEAKSRLGSMFSKGDYPDAKAVSKRWYVDVEIKPLPEAKDFRTKLSDASTKAVMADIEKRTNDRVQNAVKDVFERIADVTGKMAERLNAYEENNEGKGAFRDTLVYNVVELANLLPNLNISGDKRLDELAKQLLADCGEHSPEILRSDSKLRKQTAMKAEKLAKKAAQLLG